MEDFELEQLRRHPKWVSVLDAYQKRHSEGRNQKTDFDGWIARVSDVCEIPLGELSGIHGKLIAFGFLKFDLAGRDGGIRYQLTPLGKQGLTPSISSEDDDRMLSLVRADDLCPTE